MTERTARVVVLASLVVLCVLWILAVPPSAGPDEPSHVTRGAALVRGQFDGDLPTDGFGQVSYQLPGWIGHPNPGCYAFQPEVPATCAAQTTAPDGVVTVNSRSAGYQFWPFVLPGIGSLFPEALSSYPARVLDAALALALVGVSVLVAARVGWLAIGGVLLAFTPMAWFSVATVNPSGLAIAGGIGLWVALDVGRRGPSHQFRWLVAASWAALCLTRRDGLVWAVLIVLIAAVTSNDRLPSMWRGLGRGPQVTVAAVTAVTLVWAAGENSATSRLLLVVPAVPIVFMIACAGWDALARSGRLRRNRASIAALSLATVAGLAIVAVLDDRSRFVGEVAATGGHLTEAIGILGWLDTPIPTSALYLWIVGLGMLCSAAIMMSGWRPVVAATSTLLIGVAAAWFLEYLRNDPFGTWQGRYYLPLLAGVPILLGQSRPQWAAARVGRSVVVVAIAVTCASFAASMRRWGVGVSGPVAPWTWDTYESPLPPVVLLALFLGASVALWVGVSGLVGPSTSASAPEG